MPWSNVKVVLYQGPHYTVKLCYNVLGQIHCYNRLFTAPAEFLLILMGDDMITMNSARTDFCLVQMGNFLVPTPQTMLDTTDYLPYCQFSILTFKLKLN